MERYGSSLCDCGSIKQLSIKRRHWIITQFPTTLDSETIPCYSQFFSTVWQGIAKQHLILDKNEWIAKHIRYKTLTHQTVENSELYQLGYFQAIRVNNRKLLTCRNRAVPFPGQVPLVRFKLLGWKNIYCICLVNISLDKYLFEKQPSFEVKLQCYQFQHMRLYHISCYWLQK